MATICYECGKPIKVTSGVCPCGFGTVSLPIANVIPPVNVRNLFGSWIESGNEDKYLEELYKSRVKE